MRRILRVARLVVAIPTGIISVYLILYFASGHAPALGAAHWPIWAISCILLVILGGAIASTVAGLRPMIVGAAVGLYFAYIQVLMLGHAHATNPRWFDVTMLILAVPAGIAGGYFSSVLLRRHMATRASAI